MKLLKFKIKQMLQVIIKLILTPIIIIDMLLLALVIHIIALITITTKLIIKLFTFKSIDKLQADEEMDKKKKALVKDFFKELSTPFKNFKNKYKNIK